MKTTQHILSKIKAYSQDYLHNDQDIQVIYQNLCSVYGEENVHDGEEPFLDDCIESEVELFFNN